jgi:hypothetical protein
MGDFPLSPIVLSRDEVIVLTDFIFRLLHKMPGPEVFEDEAERLILMKIESQYEPELHEPFDPDYRRILDECRTKIRKG